MAVDNTDKRVTEVKQDVERLGLQIDAPYQPTRRGLAPIQPTAGDRSGMQIGATYQPTWVPRVTIYGEVGWTASSGDRRFPDFGQTLGRDGSTAGNVGIGLDMPFGGSATNFWFTVALMTFYIESKLNEVRNDVGGGRVQVTGLDILRGVALLAGVGGRLWPESPIWNRFEWQVLGGVGAAYNSLRGAGPAGNELFSGSQSVTPWLARFAMFYGITDNWKASLALTAVTSPEITSRLGNGTSFSTGSASNLTVMIGLAHTLGGTPIGR